ncbi:NUDIX hydrolase [Kineococcus rubinsiae]|uniref:NUDIX hydrolase n=1 Tax=Kineococcus rubinsiae TaxID=2609562 RepID=UPI001431E81D|nr:NUDIX domain-containing protein [Kineococcus rubinsiae]NIZ91983.1 NUDIX domain-containing protein [Kineococcus rubinsiae]
MTAPGTTSGPAALQRVAVHVALRSRDELLVGADGVLPWAVLRHGESPAAGAQRALTALAAPPARTGAPLEIRDAVRRVVHAGADVDVHTVHVVLGAEVTDHSVRDAARPARWVAAAGERPLVADELVEVGEAEFARLAPAGDGVERPVLRQRLAAYAVVVSARDEILLTRLSTVTPSPGRWTLPGGGVDHGEHPVAAAVREVHEETGMDVDVDALVDVGSEHFTGRSPRGVLEDFHALRVLVTATAREVRVPEVLDVGGSTDLGCWVPLDEAAGLGLVGVAHRGVQIAQRRRSATLRS